MKTIIFTLAVVLLQAACTPGVAAEPDADRRAVEAAVSDYVEALYRVEPARIERSVHRDLAKRGFWRQTPGAPLQEPTMTFDELHQLAGSWNRDGRVNAATAPKEITVLDLLDRTASAKLVAEWGIDYLHLAKYDDGWKIVNVLWQQHPESSED